MNPYLAMRRRLIEQERKRVLSDAHGHATGVRDVAQRMLREIQGGDLAATRSLFATLAQLLPQYLQPIDDHLREAEIVAQFAANMVDDAPRQEATR